ncbi:hypothetical protein [Nonomuraea sp. B19D2]|uniref:hypothetical protein n=1 Tax=Nonomuraea sp. B19D2 TaxID=3159561 RepID=UPI0032DB0D73
MPVGGDADGLVAVPFTGLAVGGQEPACGFPPLPPLVLGESCGVQMVAGAGEPFAAAHRADPPVLLVGPQTRQPVLQEVQAAGLGEPFQLGAVATRSLAGPLLPDGQGQAACDRGDGGLKVADVVGLAAAGQRPLIM